MTYQDFQNYFYSYVTSFREYYNIKIPDTTIGPFIGPTEAAFQILWDDYVNLFGECFIRTTFPQFEFDSYAVEYFNFIVRNYAIDYKDTYVKDFIIKCNSASTKETLYSVPLNTQDLGSLYNYLSKRLLIDSAFFHNTMYEVEITTNF